MGSISLKNNLPQNNDLDLESSYVLGVEEAGSARLLPIMCCVACNILTKEIHMCERILDFNFHFTMINLIHVPWLPVNHFDPDKCKT